MTRPRRLAVHGASGSGKTTLAGRLSSVLGVPHVELDALVHQPGWVPLDDRLLDAEAARIAATDAWVVDGNYSAIRPRFWARAEVIVILDPPRWRSTWRVLRRSVRRGITREELWNGNTEHVANLLRRDPARNVVLWSWRTHHRYHDEVPAAARRAAPAAEVVVLATDVAVDAFVARMAQTL